YQPLVARLVACQSQDYRRRSRCHPSRSSTASTRQQMKSATALAARPAPQLLSSQNEVCPGQVPLPIGGFPPVTDIASQSRPDASLRQRSGQFAQVIAEVLSGLRPARQVQSWLSPQVYNQLQRTLRRANR